MTIMKRCLLGASFALAMTAAFDARAQYPERNLTLIVPYGAGGGTDITARLLAKDLEPVIGKPVTVENRGGGGGWIGGARWRRRSPTATRSAISTSRACTRAISIRWSAARRASRASRPSSTT